MMYDVMSQVSSGLRVASCDPVTERALNMEIFTEFFLPPLFYRDFTIFLILTIDVAGSLSTANTLVFPFYLFILYTFDCVLFRDSF